jgi:FkbM family methyltransferase
MTTIPQGRSSGFRTRSVTERIASGAGAWLPDGARRALRGAYNALLSRTAGEFVCTLPEGERVRVLPQHRSITWNPEEYAAFRAAVQAGDVVLDVGANLGAYSLLFGFWTGPAGHVYAFEPAPVAFAGLTSHVALNGLGDRVTALQQAVTSVEGTLDFLADGLDGENRLLGDRGAMDGGLPPPAEHPLLRSRQPVDSIVRVQATTLDAFCRARHIVPAFIKIDAEGAELDVLIGARETIRLARDLQLYVEMHPRLWAGFRTSRADIEAELERQDLMAERIDGHPDIWGLEGVCLRFKKRGTCGVPRHTTPDLRR